MKVAIIGGSGFIGTCLIKLLNGHSIINLDKKLSLKYPNISKIVDVRDYKNLDNSLKSCSMVILLAAEHKDNVSPKSLYYDVNVKEHY